MRIFKNKFKTKVAILATAFVVIAGGAAFAYWTNSGAGTGTAGTGTNVAVTVNQTSVIAGMYPGQSAQTLAGNFTNTNSGPDVRHGSHRDGVHHRRDPRHRGLHRRRWQLHAWRYGSGRRERSCWRKPGRLDGSDDHHEQPCHQPGLLQGRHGHHQLRQQLIKLTSY